MNSIVKSKTAAIAIGIIGVVMMSLAPAEAATTVRDHRTAKPVVRDHRADKPDVRDHREAGSGGGVTVKNSPRKRKAADCLGDCDVKICIGAACF